MYCGNKSVAKLFKTLNLIIYLDAMDFSEAHPETINFRMETAVPYFCQQNAQLSAMQLYGQWPQ